MEEDFSIDNEFLNTPTNKKPQFVVVLCILTFVGAGLAVIGNVYNGATYNMQVKSYEMIQTMQNSIATKNIKPFKLMFGNFEELKNAIYWNSMLNWVKFVLHIPIILGAIYMLKLKRKGFYMYTIGSALILITNIILCMKVSGIGFMSFSYMVYPIIGLVGTIAFMIMYSINLKHLNS